MGAAAVVTTGGTEVPAAHPASTSIDKVADTANTALGRLLRLNTRIMVAITTPSRVEVNASLGSYSGPDRPRTGAGDVVALIAVANPPGSLQRI